MKYPKKYLFMRSILFYIYDFRCQLCDKFSFDLDLHHIDKDVQNQDVNNLKPLCKSCHKAVHKTIQIRFFKCNFKISKILNNFNKLIKEYYV